jgi:hypothetical protein
MSVIYFNSVNNDFSERLQKVLEETVSERKIERCHSMERFTGMLCRSNRGQTIVILLITAITEFYEIFSIRALLKDIRVILILPDRTSEVVSAGYKVHPRYISFIDSDLSELAGVLKKMAALVEEKIFTGRYQLGGH